MGIQQIIRQSENLQKRTEFRFWFRNLQGVLFNFKHEMEMEIEMELERCIRSSSILSTHGRTIHSFDLFFNELQTKTDKEEENNNENTLK